MNEWSMAVLLNDWMNAGWANSRWMKKWMKDPWMEDWMNEWTNEWIIDATTNEWTEDGRTHSALDWSLFICKVTMQASLLSRVDRLPSSYTFDDACGHCTAAQYAYLRQRLCRYRRLVSRMVLPKRRAPAASYPMSIDVSAAGRRQPQHDANHTFPSGCKQRGTNWTNERFICLSRAFLKPHASTLWFFDSGHSNYASLLAKW